MSIVRRRRAGLVAAAVVVVAVGLAVATGTVGLPVGPIRPVDELSPARRPAG